MRQTNRRTGLGRLAPTIGAMMLGAAFVLGITGAVHAQSEPPAQPAARAASAEFTSDFEHTPDRVWPGAAVWPNPMENWRIRDGRLECTNPRPGRNVHLLTRTIGDGEGGFALNVVLGTNNVEAGGAAGFTIGVDSQINDYRANVFRGNGLNAVVTADGKMHLAGKTLQLPKNRTLSNGDSFYLNLAARPSGDDTYELVLTAGPTAGQGQPEPLVLKNVKANRIEGGIRLTHNPRQYVDGKGANFWFQNWRVEGEKIESHEDRAFGPILWSMYTLSNSRSEAGYVMNLSAQMPPLGEEDSDTVALQIKKEKGGEWQQIKTATIDPDARNALFRVANWNADRDVPYRLVYETKRKGGETVRDTWTGTIRKNPDEKQRISISNLNCEHGSGFPYGPVAKNVAAAHPDILFFAGDQIYEGNGGYGIVRRPADKAIVSYLRKYYMHGWVFRDLMRSRPTLCIPDDHDVFQGNFWGEGGEAMSKPHQASTKGGYIEPVRTINAIYRSQTGHHPGVDQLERAKRSVRVMYGDMLYGGLSLGIVADRQFKSGPRAVETEGRRADIVTDPDLDPASLDKPGLNLLGERQLKFLRRWVRDWRGAQMKVLLSQTTFSNPMTHTGPKKERVYMDLDSNAWPQHKRDEALRVIRKGFAFHLAGDQHLTTLVQHGIETPGDSHWTFVGPAVTVGWPRWFLPEQVGLTPSRRPAHGLANTGAFRDGFDNPMWVHAVGNPPIENGPDNAPRRYQRAHRKASGFGVATFDKAQRTIRVDAYKFYANLADDDGEANQFPGWPVTVGQQSNYGRPRVGYLREVSLDGVAQPVVKVYRQAGDGAEGDAEGDGEANEDELVYAIRAKGETFTPFVFEKGTYTVKVGDPEADDWHTHQNLTIEQPINQPAGQ